MGRDRGVVCLKITLFGDQSGNRVPTEDQNASYLDNLNAEICHFLLILRVVFEVL